jgi:nucleotide-binding universal stress UspA family protein
MQMSRTVVGVDASEEARAAVKWALDQASPGDRIEVVHAWDVPLVAGYEVAVAIDPREIENASRGFLDKLISEIGDPRLEPVLAQGHPGRSITEVAQGADLVVVGHRGSGKASVILGSTANYVLHHVEQPVVVIRGDHHDTPRHVVVGVDEHGIDAEDPDNPSVRALRWAYGLRGVERIDVMHAWFAPAVAMGLYAGAGADMEQMDAAALDVIARVMEVAGPGPTGVEIRQIAERGTPGFALVEASRDCDMIVVGSRGRGGFVGLLLGSTSLEVAAHSHAPVAILR